MFVQNPPLPPHRLVLQGIQTLLKKANVKIVFELLKFQELILWIVYFQDTIKQLQEELRCIEDAETLCVSFTEWLSSSQKSFASLTDHSEPLDRASMEKKMKKLEVWVYQNGFIPVIYADQ